VTAPRSLRTASRMPTWLGSIRVRLAVVYSIILFSLAALVVLAVYVSVARALADEPLSRVQVVSPTPGGLRIEEQDFRTVESLVNEATLEKLRGYSFVALGFLFVASIGVGWFVAGMVLRPIERITQVARDIQASDLSRRIALAGPNDELKQLADTFDDMLGRIDEAFEGQRQLIHETSHELRNPLAVIRTNLDVTLADPDASADDLRHTAEVVQKSTERIGRVVDDLLVYARKGSLSMAREPLDAGQVVLEAADEFEASARERGIDLERVVEPDLWVEGDRLGLGQALANLLANAVRLSPEGSTIRLSAGREGPWVWLAVQDQGPGIAPEDQERVFQRFWRGDPRQGPDPGRSGLGLTIVRQVAEAHGGAVKLVSEPGRGSAFALWLPAHVGPPGRAPTPAPGPPTA
jgi:signal transduction histidine kinase